MAVLHPKLSCRPRQPKGLNRPTLKDPILGTIEYINRDGGWWQGVATIAEAAVRMDVQLNANPEQNALDAAADCLRWLQQNETTVRAYIAKQLKAGEYELRLDRNVPATPIDEAMAIVASLRPSMLVLSRDWTILEYDFASLPDGGLFGAQRASVCIEQGTMLCRDLNIYAPALRTRVRHLFERPIPADALDFQDSIADQFLAKLSEWDKIRFDPELITLLEGAIADVECRIRAGSAECVSFMFDVKFVLSELAKTAMAAPPVISHLRAEVRVRHPAGKRKPFKTKLDFIPGEEAMFDGAGAFPRISLFVLHESSYEKTAEPDEAFQAAVKEKLAVAAQWLSRQTPTVFQELREAGFLTDIDFMMLVRVASADIRLLWPLEFIAQCTRLGLTLSVTMSNID